MDPTSQCSLTTSFSECKPFSLPLSASAPVLCTDPKFFLIDPKSTPAAAAVEGVIESCFFFALKDELKKVEDAKDDADEAMEEVECADRRRP